MKFLKKLKDVRIILIIFLVVLLIVGVLFFISYKGKQEAAIAEKDAEIMQLNEQLGAIGTLYPAVYVVGDCKSGKTIEESDLDYVEVPEAIVGSLAQDIDELVGMHFKTDMTAGTLVTVDSVYEEVLSTDMRYYDVICDNIPIGIQDGSYVDIRIQFGTGADYIGISHRQVISVFNNRCMRLILSEKDIQTYSSMLYDSIVFNTPISVVQDRKLTDDNGAIHEEWGVDYNRDGRVEQVERLNPVGARIYALEYVEAGIQQETVNFYTPSTLVQGIMKGNLNIKAEDMTSTDKALTRMLIESGIITTVDDITKKSLLTASDIKNQVTTVLDEAARSYEEYLEKKRLEEESEY